MRGTNLNCFTDVLQYCMTVFKRIITKKDVKMTSRLGLWIILMAAFKLSTQNNIKLQYTDCSINSMVYIGLQLLYNEKLREDFFYIPGLSI